MDEKMRKIFAENLNHYLAINGYSQADLARHMHVSTATTAKWCTAQSIPRLDKIQAICSWLGIEKTELLEPADANAPEYYFNRDARDLADFLHKNPEYKILFDASRKVKKSDIETVVKMLNGLRDEP